MRRLAFQALLYSGTTILAVDSDLRLLNEPAPLNVPNGGVPEPFDVEYFTESKATLKAKHNLMGQLFHQSTFPFMQKPGTNCGNTQSSNSYHASPWSIALIMCKGKENRSKCVKCGGVLVSYDYAITSAACVEGYRTSLDNTNTRIYYGIHDFDWETSVPGYNSTGKVIEIAVHPDYLENDYPVNLATVKVSQYDGFSSLVESDFVKPACFPDQKLCKLPGNVCSSPGWRDVTHGEDGTDDLTADAYTVLQDVPMTLCPSMQQDQVCTNSTHLELCHGDGGGLMTCNADNGIAYVYGVGGECDNFYIRNNDHPNSFHRVTEHLEWLETATNVILEGSSRALGMCFDDPDANMVMARAFGGDPDAGFGGIDSGYSSNEYYDISYEDSSGSGESDKANGIIDDQYFEYGANKIVSLDGSGGSGDGDGTVDLFDQFEARNAGENLQAVKRKCGDIRDDVDFVWPATGLSFDDHFQLGDGTCIFPEEGDRCRIFPTGKCAKRDIAAVYVRVQHIDDSWTDDFHRTKHFECGFDDMSQKMRWKRISTGVVDPPSNFGKFEIKCGPPPCDHPSRFEKEALNLDGQNGIQVENGNLNQNRNGDWECFSESGEEVVQNMHVPYGGRCYFRCKNPVVDSSDKPIVCSLPNLPGAAQYDFIGRLYKYLTMAKFSNSRRFSQMVDDEGERMGWKCHV